MFPFREAASMRPASVNFGGLPSLPYILPALWERTPPFGSDWIAFKTMVSGETMKNHDLGLLFGYLK